MRLAKDRLIVTDGFRCPPEKGPAIDNPKYRKQLTIKVEYGLSHLFEMGCKYVETHIPKHKMKVAKD